MADISDMTYDSSGVSIKSQNRVNKEVVERLRTLGMRAEGLFGGAIDISSYKGKKTYVGIQGASISEKQEWMIDTGTYTTQKAFEKVTGKSQGVLDYFASPFMDERIVSFVEGIARESMKNKTPVIGGESAQMKDTYREGEYDAFVHVIEITKEKGKYSCDITDLIKGMKNPLLVASTDGTGTKTKIVRNPLDIIYHGFNDIGAVGVKPIAFGIYIAGNVPGRELKKIEKKSDKACKDLGITKLKPLVEYKPETYLKGEVDIAGTVIGVVNEKDMITGKNVKEGDVVIGIGVDAIMTNGYTLARNSGKELLGDMKEGGWDSPMEEFDGNTFRQEMSKSHVPMTDILFGTKEKEGVLSKYPGAVRATAHITGGGQKYNIKRMVPDGLCAEVKKEVLPIPLVMKFFVDRGLEEEEAYKTFNMGVGFTLTTTEEMAYDIVEHINRNFALRLDSERPAAIIGEIVKNEKTKFVFKD